MKKLKRSILFSLCCSFIFSLFSTNLIFVCSPANIFAASETSTPHLSVEKTTFDVGEPIMVTPTAENPGQGDWVAIMPAASDIAHIYIVYRYIETTMGSAADNSIGYGSGVAFDIRLGYRNNAVSAVTGLHSIPAGDYYIAFIPKNQSAVGNVTEKIKITVKDSHQSGEDQMISHISLEKTAFDVGEPIMVTPTVENPGQGDWVAIMSADPSLSHIYLHYRYIETTWGKESDNTIGLGSGIAFDIRKGHTNGSTTVSQLISIPAGEYYICFIPRNQSGNGGVTERIKITVTTKTPPKPDLVTYSLDDMNDGLAGGKLTVSFSKDGMIVTDIELCWGDANGNPLAAYTPLAKQHADADGTTEISMFSNMMIPANAKSLLVYATNAAGRSDPYVLNLPNNCQFNREDKPLFEFQVVSDIHLTTNGSDLHAKHYEQMLREVATLSPDSKGIFVVGDMTDSGHITEYNHLKNIYQQVLNDCPALADIYLAIGNHEFKNSNTDAYGNPDERISAFLNAAKNFANGEQSKVYYDTWINGCHFIMLGSEWCEQGTPGKGKDAFISDEQLNWLQNTLAEDYVANRPIFLFLHNSLYNTVAGGLAGQGWNGVIAGGNERQNVSSGGNANAMLNAEKKLREILADYPEILMFNGHSHWQLNSEGTMHVVNEALPYIFNTASVGYLWNDYQIKTGEYLKGSQGYFVKVYADRVEVLGRDFTNGKWVASASFVTNTGDFNISLPTEPENPNRPGNTPDDPSGKTEDTNNMKPLMIALISCGVAFAAGITVFIVLKKKKS